MNEFNRLLLQKNSLNQTKQAQRASKVLSTLLLVPLVGFSACSRGTDDSDTLAANKRGVIPWPHGKIEVCIVEAESKYQREIVQYVGSTFEKSGVQFVSWKDCKPNDGVKVRIFIGTANAKAYSSFLGSTLLKGHYIDAKASSLDANVFISHGNDKCDAEQKKVVCIYNTALHILSHVAGLYHQQDSQLKHQSKGTCAFHSVDAQNENKELIKVKSIVPNQFDKESIMNDCIPESFTQKKSLSPGDIETLKALYGGKEETDPNNLNTYLGKPCNHNKNAAGKMSTVNNSVVIVCNDNKNSETGFAWELMSTANPLGVECNRDGLDGGRPNGEVTCKEFAGSATGWRWQKSVPGETFTEISTFLHKPCNHNKDAAGKLSLVNNSVQIVCNENEKSATGFSWHLVDAKYPQGVQCNHSGTGAGDKNGDLTCKQFAGSPTGWRWLK